MIKSMNSFKFKIKLLKNGVPCSRSSSINCKGLFYNQQHIYVVHCSRTTSPPSADGLWTFVSHKG
ncbi:hypothetical protein T11_4012 [Trichinella zimbabwensis]|uniref:Uncharacterized protein n=1 Tax=Trichinella zimbabwensis TaxID=268475 RepID=A0A0V1HCA3_9BILA|nr:hypothetical protein T11_4012 [Trichinella zimbabwensis]